MSATSEARARGNTVDIAAVQEALSRQKLDGWLFYSFHGNDPLASRILGLADSHFVSRRWFYLIPAKGTPQKLVHRIEMDALDILPGEKQSYLGWQQLFERLGELLKGHRRVAMQYSSNNAIPYISRVDAGTIELIRGLGVEVVSSADLVQQFEATWSKEQLKSHKEAGEALRKIVFEAFAHVKEKISAGQELNEFQLQQFIVDGYQRYGMTSNSRPIVAVNAHAGSPHYQPSEDVHWPIKRDDLLLLDIWAKRTEPHDAVYADITWTGFVSDAVPEKYKKIFDIVSGARDAALDFVKKAVGAKRPLRGYEVDDVARNFIDGKGYGEYFLHRTGHSIGTEVHGNGANIDNLETQDSRSLIANTGFSIEPGIYLDDFGIRSEIDVFIGEGEVIVAGLPIQTEIIPILK